jgi:hypothetical protein
MQERFQKAIYSEVNPKSKIKEDSYSRDLKYYVRYEQRTLSLYKLFDAMMSAQPTSTQSERNVSLAGSFMTKLRTSFSDDHLNVLGFLKSFFIRKAL